MALDIFSSWLSVTSILGNGCIGLHVNIDEVNPRLPLYINV